MDVTGGEGESEARINVAQDALCFKDGHILTQTRSWA